MIRHYFKYEWMNVRRERLFALLSALFLMIMIFAGYNGEKKVQTRKDGIARVRAEVEAFDKKAAADIDSINSGLKKAPESWYDPRALSVFGQRGARVVAMDPAPLAMLATGQSDLYSHSVRPRIGSESHSLRFSELSNPVQLLFGTFDISFVCVYLLPLLVLAFSFNILSEEKEQGIFRLTGAQPISIFNWLLSKIAFRFLLVSALIIVSLLVTLLLNGVPLGPDLAKVILIILAYALFWFVVAVIVNLAGRSSGYNVAVLVGIWMVIVILMPSIISQLANTLYPVPSRINMIHEYRVAQAEAAKKTEDILKGYLNDHPELAPKDPAGTNQYSWWLGYFARANIVNAAVEPIVNACDGAIADQQQLVTNFRFVSPAILLQDALNDVAGTSTAHYTDFRRQVVEFSAKWKSYFSPRMFANENMKSSDLPGLPQHTYSDDNVYSTWFADFAGVVLFTAFAFVLSVFYYRRVAAGSLLIT